MTQLRSVQSFGSWGKFNSIELSLSNLPLELCDTVASFYRRAWDGTFKA